LKRSLLVLAVALSCALPVGAQTLFRASLDGFQTVPAVPGTLAGGWADVTLDTTTNRIVYELRTFGLIGTAAHIRLGPPGVSGPIQVPLSGGPTTWSGLSIPLGAAQIAALRAGDWYMDVHTALHPAGEIRGQVLARPHQFGTKLDGLQEVPPSGSGARGDAAITLNPDATISYTVTTAGVVGTAAHIHDGAFGTNGGIEVTLDGGPSAWVGTSAPLTPAQIEALQTKRWYVNVHSAAFPGGEIRGQLVPAGIPYGPNSHPPTGEITLNAVGAPTDLGSGGLVRLSIANGRPGGFGYMLSSLGRDALLFKDEPFLVNLGLAFNVTLLPLDAAGALDITFATPVLHTDFVLYMQFFSLDPAAPNGKYNASNGLALPFSDF
jgi:hypothetical protein